MLSVHVDPVQVGKVKSVKMQTQKTCLPSTVTDELSTIPGATVMVTPGLAFKVKRNPGEVEEETETG